MNSWASGADARLGGLLAALDRTYDGPSWHGPSLAEAVAGLTEAGASWRPAPDAHNAWEYAVHAAYWAWRALTALDPETGPFGEPGENFFGRPADGHRLGDDLARLEACHRRLRTVVAALDPGRLSEVAYRSYTVADVIAGVADHHVYHAGQIRLLRRLAPEG